ncbi:MULTISPECIES: ATP-dependent sacrificial sulfur transferase LarE [Prochlorococcus]|uniref:ATP-utilizing enzyme, PP-loop superfamily n=2 Tax=Prochlorococcus TaxID=1218 RepID=Q7V9U8_PROMA|nr:ATP-utilizing enzyme, PP-loop superfamily [Prochlorococcus marinus subsp. marinus str. CCMP1375]KGG10735.1 ATP-utilizing enzyme of the PP-loop [Prochlorococcus marinus str. LG]KGG21157.1 ATP-utilizing enzyme of the PP-loop [Prochlorococcus marinus str. SS2]KGG23981.1 ATP-utilizing enzyme of the PP-loop [Prochlorococcus marinus str. SS35]KGG31759.1 ATP-utilizing enzyme of the PP-loop [Prochlorococcus marinus str. SS51]
MLKLQDQLAKSNVKQLDLLRDFIKDLKKVCIAYSGGVDSSLIAAIGKEQLDNNAIAVTGVSASLAPHLLEEARLQARWIGIEHQECKTNELQDPNYKANPIDRCFACKKELHNNLGIIAKKFSNAQVVDGVNADDIKDYRPGIEAAHLAGVKSPLAELQINKASIREISKALGLPWWDKPAQPCLASRFHYGDPINLERLKQVAKAEKWLIDKGFPKVRVRVQGLVARIEVPTNRISDLLSHSNRTELIDYFLSIGFSAISVDLEGLISGKLNRENNLSDTPKIS